MTGMLGRKYCRTEEETGAIIGEHHMAAVPALALLALPLGLAGPKLDPLNHLPPLPLNLAIIGWGLDTVCDSFAFSCFAARLVHWLRGELNVAADGWFFLEGNQ
jgi:hypothetical protein